MLIFFFLICILLYLYGIAIANRKRDTLSIYSSSVTISTDNLFLLLSFPFFLLISGLRHHDIGCDTNTYIRWFQDISLGWSYEDFAKEKGYYFYNKLVLLFSTDPQFFLFINSLILIIGYFTFIKRESKLVFVSVCLFVLMRYFDCCMNLLRQSLALVIVLYSYQFVKKRRFLPFLFCLLFASQFHYTSFFFILSWPCIMLARKFNRKYLFVYVLIVIAFYFMSKALISFFFTNIPYYDMYEDSKYNHLQHAKIANIMFLLVSLFIVLFAYLDRPHLYNYAMNDSKNEYSLDWEMRLLFLFQLLATLFYVIALNFSQIIRVAYYFNVFSIIFLANILAQKRGKTLLRKGALLLTVFLVYYITISVLRPNWSGIYPYKFFFE